ncbi:helix-turn-helix domain-containing protein [candidate division KSB1 bacterium]|nr:MAG: helix-turn-helix domain-containing protein [candidate division KSB1 bacterium]
MLSVDLPLAASIPSNGNAITLFGNNWSVPVCLQNKWDTIWLNLMEGLARKCWFFCGFLGLGLGFRLAFLRAFWFALGVTYATQRSRRSSDKVAVKRAACVLAAASGMTVPQISQSQFVHETYVRKILNGFNADGLASIGNRCGIGRPRIFDDAVRREIYRIVTTLPARLGLPFTVWSLPKLREVLVAQKIVATISIEWLRRILLDANITPQRTKTRKQSNDEHYPEKKDGSTAVITMRKRGGSRSSA